MSYLRLLSRLYDTPLALSNDKLELITSSVTLNLFEGKPTGETATPRDKEVPQGKAIIKVFDGMVSRGEGAGSVSATSYSGILSQSRSLVAEGHTTLYFYYDTPGGEVTSLFSTAKELRLLAKEHGVKLIGIVDGELCSAGMVLGAAMDELYATSSSILGSMAVITTVLSVKESNDKAGRKYKILRSKDEKALLNPHENFDQKAIEARLQLIKDVDVQMMDLLVELRPSMSLETIKSLNGRIVLAKEALNLSLIDGIVASLDEVLAKDTTLILTNGPKPMTLQEAQNKIAALTTENTALVAKASTASSLAAAEERARITGILSAAETLHLEPAAALKSINSPTRTVAEATEMFEEIAEAKGLGNALDVNRQMHAITPPPSATDFNSLLSASFASEQDSPLFPGL